MLCNDGAVDLIAKILINSLKLMYRNYSVNLTLMVVPFYFRTRFGIEEENVHAARL